MRFFSSPKIRVRRGLSVLLSMPVVLCHYRRDKMGDCIRKMRPSSSKPALLISSRIKKQPYFCLTTIYDFFSNVIYGWSLSYCIPQLRSCPFLSCSSTTITLFHWLKLTNEIGWPSLLTTLAIILHFIKSVMKCSLSKDREKIRSTSICAFKKIKR